MHHIPFGGRDPAGSAGGAYSAPLDLLAGLKGWGPREGEGRTEGVGERGERKGSDEERGREEGRGW